MADLMESRCGSLPTAQLTPHAEQFLSLLERKGIVPDQEITNEKARSADKALRKNMYHNTRLMLQHYRRTRNRTLRQSYPQVKRRLAGQRKRSSPLMRSVRS